MRRLLLLLLLVAAIGVGADLAAARAFESRVGDALERKYQLERRPIVQVRDFPFLPHLLSGRLSTLDLAATDARASGITLDRVEVHLRGCGCRGRCCSVGMAWCGSTAPKGRSS
jgi:hypothetical protein